VSPQSNVVGHGLTLIGTRSLPALAPEETEIVNPALPRALILIQFGRYPASVAAAPYGTAGFFPTSDMNAS